MNKYWKTLHDNMVSEEISNVIKENLFVSVDDSKMPFGFNNL